MTDSRKVEVIAKNCTEELLELVSKSISKKEFSLKTPILNLSKMSNPNMASQSSPEKHEIQLLINTLPEYYPGQNLALFINEVDNLCTHLANRLTPDLVYVVNCSIRSKIKGEARDFISYQGLIEWVEIRKSLLQKYGDQRSEDLLVSAVAQCVQNPSESYMDYYSRLLKAGNSLMQNITLNITDPGLLGYKKTEYSKLALKTFQNGILEPYRGYLSHFELTTIEECLNKCKTLDNQRQEWDYSEFIRKSQDSSKKPSHQINSTPNIFKPLIPSFSKPSPTPFKPPVFNSTQQPFKPPIFNSSQQPFRPPVFNPTHQPFRQSFTPYNQPNRPFAAQNQPFKPFSPPNFQKAFQNPPAFGPKPNFKPPPAEPMSIQSRVRSQQVPTNKPWQSRPLFNVEKECNEQYESDPSDMYEYYDQSEYYNYYVHDELDPEQYQEQNEELQLNEQEEVNFQKQASNSNPP